MSTTDLILPVALDAERSILGAILLNNEHYYEAIERIDANDFMLEAHKSLFRVMGEMVDKGQPVDLITIRTALSQQKLTESVGGISYVASLTEGVPHKVSIEEYVRIVQEKSIGRQALSVFQSTATEISDQSDDPAAVIARTQEALYGLTERGLRGGFQTVEEAILSKHSGIESFLKGSVIQGAVNTGYYDFDRKTGGLKKGELMILAGRPGSGKTAMALCIANNVALRQNKRVGIVSLEMSKDACIWRMVTAEIPQTMAIDGKRIRENRMSQNESLKVYETLGELIGAPVYIEDAGPFTTTAIRAKTRRLQKQYGLDLLIIDYLQLMSGSRRENKTQEVTEISRNLKLLAKELDVPVIALSQLSREAAKREDKMPQLTDLRDSGSIEQDADVVVFIHRPEVYDPTNHALKGVATLRVAKQREGPLFDVDMIYFSEKTRFEERAQYHMNHVEEPDAL